ncbi:MAG: DUF6089 family protein [Crocinitomicaceae bacterium]
MKKIFFVIAITLLHYSVLSQKYNLGFGVKAGIANYLGDIGGGDLARPFVFNLELKDTRWSTGAFVRYRFHPLFAYQGSFTYARVQGKDSESDNRARQGRNLSFKNDILCLDHKLEFYPSQLSMSDVGRRGRYRTDFKTFIFAGIGTIFHNPKALYNGDWVKLRPLMTEGEKYSKFSFSIPVGAGFYFTYRKQHRFGFELSWNYTFTDYLDDVSGVYVDPSAMSSDPLAPILANRNPELNYSENDYPASANFGPKISGQTNLNKRGDASANDNFILMTLSYSYVIKSNNGFNRSYSWLYRSKSRFGKTKARF